MSFADASDEPTFNPLWGLSGHPGQIVPIESLVRLGVAEPLSRMDDQLVWQDEAVCVRGAVDKYSQIRGDCWNRKIDGCFGCPKNICRNHALAADRAARLEALTAHASAFVGTMPREEVLSSTVLLKLVGVSPGLPPLARFWLVTSARFSPKMLYVARCHLVDETSDEDYPVLISISSREARLPGNNCTKVAWLETSDEMCNWCLSERSSWEVHRATYELRA